ncbi:MAG: TrmJ/YjtD family RNA methyltransferase [Gammaproteobacteria bacterium]|nr:TrmJ/YjtD family RNA methyltransferase [Gammaproteobacteria bacterium]
MAVCPASPTLSALRVVLVETSHPGNIGAVARAMKTMGLTDLRLVGPQEFPCADATARASGADDLLQEAVVCERLGEALSGCIYAFAATARLRELSHVEFTPREAAAQAISRAVEGPVAVVFGREKHGLSNVEVDACQALIRIPANAHYSSLNLAAAVQIVAYELRMAALLEAPSPGNRVPVGIDELEGLYGHFERALRTIGYYDPDNPGKLMRRLRRLMARAELDGAELRILRGILTAAERSVAKRGAP